MVASLYYPRGYRLWAENGVGDRTDCQPTGHRRDQAYLVLQGDPHVNQLHAQYRTNHGLFWTLSRVEELLAVARYLVPSFNEFITAQIKNRALHRHQIEFLEDTIYKIGWDLDRRMAPMTYMELMDDYPTPRGDVTHRQLRHIRIDRCYPSGERLIEYWLSHPNGCDDLLETLYVLFGAPRAS